MDNINRRSRASSVVDEVLEVPILVAVASCRTRMLSGSGAGPSRPAAIDSVSQACSG